MRKTSLPLLVLAVGFVYGTVRTCDYLVDGKAFYQYQKLQGHSCNKEKRNESDRTD